MRERVYIVGFRKDLNIQNFEFPEGNNENLDISNFFYEDNIEYLDNTNKTFNKYLNNKYNNLKYCVKDLLELENHIIDRRQSDLRIYKNTCPTLRAGRHGILY